MRSLAVKAALRASLVPKKQWLECATTFVSMEWEKPETWSYADHLIPKLYRDGSTLVGLKRPTTRSPGSTYDYDEVPEIIR